MKHAVFLLAAVAAVAASAVSQGTTTPHCTGTDGSVYGISERWDDGKCQTCLCTSVGGKAEKVCFSKTVCKTKSPTCIGTSRMILVPEIDPCCPVCRTLEQRCGNCTNDDTNYPVCGTDGNTYKNACNLKFEACAQEKNFKMAYEGECKVAEPTPEPVKPATSAAPTPEAEPETNDTGAIIGIVCAILGIIVFTGVAAFFFVKRRGAARQYAVRDHNFSADFESSIGNGSKKPQTSMYPLHTPENATSSHYVGADDRDNNSNTSELDAVSPKEKDPEVERRAQALRSGVGAHRKEYLDDEDDEPERPATPDHNKL